MNCKKCDRLLDQSDQFCQFCGMPVAKTVKGVHGFFRGRIGRKDFFLGLLSLTLLFAVVSGIIFICFALFVGILPDTVAFVARWFNGILIVLCALVALSFSLSLYVRRVHDIGKSSWWLLLLLVPFINYGMVLYLLFKKGEESENRFGDEPLSGVGLMDTIFNRHAPAKRPDL